MCTHVGAWRAISGLDLIVTEGKPTQTTTATTTTTTTIPQTTADVSE
mgnify:CR=1 FL=1